MLSAEEVQAMLKKSKVYIDFGGHPGMEHIPREAALAGRIIVTNRAGSAGGVSTGCAHSFSI